jgi:hypothetical protein
MGKRIAVIAATITSGIVVGEQLWSRVTSEGRYVRRAVCHEIDAELRRRERLPI